MRNKEFITEYVQALGGKPKPEDVVRRYVSDEHLAKHIAGVEAAFPEYDIKVEDLLAEGDKVMLRGVFSGVHRGEFVGIPPTGRAVTAGLMIVYRIEDGRIAQHWMQFDLFTLLQQLTGAGAAA